MTLTDEEYALRESRIANAIDHVFPLSQQEVADLIGVCREQYNKVLRRRGWFTLELYEKVMDIDLGWYLDAYPKSRESKLSRMRKVVEDYDKALIFIEKYG